MKLSDAEKKDLQKAVLDAAHAVLKHVKDAPGQGDAVAAAAQFLTTPVVASSLNVGPHYYQGG